MPLEFLLHHDASAVIGEETVLSGLNLIIAVNVVIDSSVLCVTRLIRNFLQISVQLKMTNECLLQGGCLGRDDEAGFPLEAMALAGTQKKQAYQGEGLHGKKSYH